MLEHKVKTLRTDRRREYQSDQFMKLYCQRGIVQQVTMPYTSQQIGVTERHDRMLFDMVRSMIA